MERVLGFLSLVVVILAMLAGAAPVLAQEGEHFGVAIDIKPGSDTNPLNLKSNGLVPVALFGGAGFDVQDVDLETVALHAHERPETAVSPVRYSFQDVNGDGFTDILFHFATGNLAQILRPGDSELCLHGDNPEITPPHFCGMDSVSIKFE
jgi:hypothetical protein